MIRGMRKKIMKFPAIIATVTIIPISVPVIFISYRIKLYYVKYVSPCRA